MDERDKLCAEWGPDDGIDPRDWAKAEPRRTPSRKARQLCQQVAEALHQALAGSADDVLRELVVVEVQPAPNAARLLVRLTGSAEASEPVQRASGWLRCAVAAAIHRRKTPELVFHVVER